MIELFYIEDLTDPGFFYRYGEDSFVGIKFATPYSSKLEAIQRIQELDKTKYYRIETVYVFQGYQR